MFHLKLDIQLKPVFSEKQREIINNFLSQQYLITNIFYVLCKKIKVVSDL